MYMESLESIKTTLIACAHSQMENLERVDAKELGEVIDMIKDIEEAMYYCTITEAMTQKESENVYGRTYYEPRYYSYPSTIGNRHGDSVNESNAWDMREGRSHHVRKTYMESKEMNKDKATQLKELEKYMQELTQDMVEMIDGASPEERQYLEKRVSALASKIGQVK